MLRNSNRLAWVVLILLAATSGGRAQPAGPTDADVHEWAREAGDRADSLDRRRRACRKLGQAGERSTTAIAALVRALADKDLAYWAAEGLWKAGPAGRAAAKAYGPTVPADSLVARVSAGLGAGDDAPFSGLLRLVGDRDPAVRLWAVETLTALGEGDVKDGKLRTAISGYLRKAAETDREVNIRSASTLALAKLAHDRGLVPLLTRLIADKTTDPASRTTAARRLGELGLEAAAADLHLVVALTDVDRDTRLAAAQALGKVCDDGPAIVGALRAAAGRAERDDRKLAAAARESIRAIEARIEARQEQTRKALLAELRTEQMGRAMAEIEAQYQRKVREIERDQAAFRREVDERFADSFRDGYRHTFEDHQRYYEWHIQYLKRANK